MDPKSETGGCEEASDFVLVLVRGEFVEVSGDRFAAPGFRGEGPRGLPHSLDEPDVVLGRLHVLEPDELGGAQLDEANERSPRTGLDRVAPRR